MDSIPKEEIDIMDPEAKSIKIDTSMFAMNPDNFEDTKNDLKTGKYLNTDPKKGIFPSHDVKIFSNMKRQRS